VNYRRLRPFQIKVGKFKVPFGLDQLTSPTDLEFVYRSRLGSYLAPARDRGVLAHGRFFDRGLGYHAGYFLHDGENAELKSNQPSGGRTLAGRLTAKPLQFFSLPAVLRAVELAGALTQTHLPEGVNGLRAHTVSGDTFFDRVFVKGRRWRTGAELNWTWEPFSVKGEFAEARDERQGQGLRGNDLSDALCRAWYLSATYSLLRKEQGRKRMIPQAVLLDGKTGTVQLAARYEQIRFGSADHPGRPSRTPRAANILGNSDRVWTVGVNWYLNRYAKILGNAIHETIEDVQRAPVSGRSQYWMWVARLQFVM
jgi:phosphate-selective porin OprO/OprP